MIIRPGKPFQIALAVGTILFLAADPAPGDRTDGGPDATRFFYAKVQPVLYNACVSCHSASHAKLPLRRNDGPANLAAALNEIDRKNPMESNFLKQAVTAHGGAARPPIKDTNVPAYKHLEAWVKSVCDDGKSATAKSTPATTAKHQGFRDEFDPEIFNRMSQASR